MSTENVPTKRCDRCGVMETKLRDVESVSLVLSYSHAPSNIKQIISKKGLDLCAKCGKRLERFVGRGLETPSLDQMPPKEGLKLVETDDDEK